MEELHQPVLLSEVGQWLDPQPGESYLDLTAGYGGHASRILDLTQNYKAAVLCDRDEMAINYLRQKYAEQGVELAHTDFYSLVSKKFECGSKFDIILADFGVSSPQLDRGERGFSFQHDGNLDMRMDRRQELTAAEVVNHYSEGKLAEVFERFGELRPGEAKHMAREIVHRRPFARTGELAEFIKSKSRYTRMHPATKYFQAIRIEVNDEIGEIARSLPLLPDLLNPGGRLGLISFHSLEDRLVKDFFRAESELGEEARLEILTKKPVQAENMELFTNPRARSAKLRVAKRK